MSSKLPTTLLRRPSALPSTTTYTAYSASRPTPPSCTAHGAQGQQIRNATFVPRHRRPYQFTQLVQLSDGSTFTVRTTMPTALYKSAKDSRNHLLWQPSDKSLKNVELDEAGKLAAFRERYGRGWDLDAKMTPEEEAAAAAALAAGGGAGVPGGKAAKKAAEEALLAKKKKEEEEAAKKAAEAEEADPFDSLTDLISGYATENMNPGLNFKETRHYGKKK
ncbi:hypothetical protein GE21DRAFT_8131 [Neurospora crassa]|uniref:Large ribosomal subunit protein bL31m n=2 Tax=Neurospora crassa TaxID=5141 RepID=RM36_NEUCR|nr:hypothetical protein NCU04138 [Neurospora crassa OR74A]Q1K7L7.1 RecName: Full=Large ribosomal subunit protein bL31m [Neurospora crassa OR74A]6YW5_V Chain V, IF1 [Neurospora crassa OR74A]6YWE_V Chain V, Related to ribosomal protein YmL36, mitochondrial [Neurospora crassa]6YWS_V Chain V, Uncharacterized protein [Neurospora crassa OR74A]6YWV_V Chain V, Uncharacterized protein [Neurospora crassa OR74A]6YWX_V Chain V, bL31m [Neurospora crassa OR74A]6YWY_V Chain V, Related to ribosomal protein |eukprot:XP_961294.1 hypothetical protein NCU04138 [Neurospora crassa OR74A]